MAGGHPGHTAAFSSPADVAKTLQPCIDNLKKPQGQRDENLTECAAFIERGVQKLAGQSGQGDQQSS